MMPFPGGLEATANATLIFAVIAALYYLRLVEAPVSLARSVVKTASILLLAMLSWVQDGPLLTAALLLSAAGDAFLSRDGEPAFLGGLASFLAAHIAYIVLFYGAGAGLAHLFDVPWRLFLALAMAAYAGAMIVLLLPRVARDLRPPIVAYALAILAMGLSALTLDVPLVLVGSLLFMVSDGILAAEKFLLPASSPLQRPLRYTVWISYAAAQVSITLGVLLAG
jgi:uncharacterized membrane protein YhhN